MSIVPSNPNKRARPTTPWQVKASDLYAIFPVLSSPPNGAQQGWVYYDDGTNTANGLSGLRKFDGSDWVDVGGIENGLLVVNELQTDLIQFNASSAEPGVGSAGLIYYDDGTNTASGTAGLRAYNGSAWTDVSPQEKRGLITSGVEVGGAAFPFTLTGTGVRWTRFGNMVNVSGLITWSSTNAGGAGTDLVSVTGALPYDAASLSGTRFFVGNCDVSEMAAGYLGYALRMTDNGSTVFLLGTDTSTGIFNIVNRSWITDTAGGMYFNITYETDEAF